MTNRETDIAIATHVMQWKRYDDPALDFLPYQGWIDDSAKFGVLPEFSTDISAAMTVSEKCGRFDMIPVDDGWMVGDGRGGYSTDHGFVETKLEPFAIAKELPRAICDAALKAHGVEVPE